MPASRGIWNPLQHRLFIGFRPPLAAIPEISRIRDAFPSRRPVPDGQLHMTLLPFPLYAKFPALLAAHVVRLLSAAELPCCRIIVDRLVLAERSGLLQPSEPVLGLRSLQRKLAGLASEARLHVLEKHRFSPHLTLFHGGPSGSCADIDPISWTAEELVLVHSLYGAGRHEILKRWPLKSRAPESPGAPSRSV